MITAIRSNQPSFKEVTFEPGFNVILADRTREASQRDSRNGLGKTTLIEIIHFCLGASSRPNRGLRDPNLKGWDFSLEINVGGRELIVTRSTDQPNMVVVRGSIQGLIAAREPEDGVYSLRINEWNQVLGQLVFGLYNLDSEHKYRPSFRSLISFFMRHGRGSFSSPFVHHDRQSESDKQINNAFLLNLMWEHASQFQELKDRVKILNEIRRAVDEGLIGGTVGSVGSLEAERARLESEAQRQSEILRSFQVHPRYREIEDEANQLTADIRTLSNDNLVDGRLINLYRDALDKEDEPDTVQLLEIYRDVGVTMPELVHRRLDEVRDFHQQIVANRRDYLNSDIQRLESNRIRRDRQIETASGTRAQLLGVLKTYGALQEYTRLQELQNELVRKLSDVDHLISELTRYERERSEARVKQELLLQTARREFDERREVRERAINLFNSNSEALYQAYGQLELEVAETGFKFDVKIMRSGSHGIENMKVFCYDLMLAQLWAHEQPSPKILIHDSTIFDGVDERQQAVALELAQRESEKRGFQYICALNSDTVPEGDFSPEFDLDRYVQLRLTDETEEGGLLGFRY